jgi:D-serine deaminase-like pyridoxal phosphate-dependent protein
MELMARMAKAGRRVMLMADCLEHLKALSLAGQKVGTEILACLEVDMAYRPLGAGAVHLGLRRSPLRTPDEALALVRSAKGLPNVRINSIMGYEGHIAGTSDNVPGKSLNNALMRFVKRQSIHEFTPRRDGVVKALRAEGLQLEIVNGGGSGSLVSTLMDPLVNEVTVGSGFYCSALFHHFREVEYRSGRPGQAAQASAARRLEIPFLGRRGRGPDAARAAHRLPQAGTGRPGHFPTRQGG